MKKNIRVSASIGLLAFLESFLLPLGVQAANIQVTSCTGTIKLEYSQGEETKTINDFCPHRQNYPLYADYTLYLDLKDKKTKITFQCMYQDPKSRTPTIRPNTFPKSGKPTTIKIADYCNTSGDRKGSE